MACHVVDTVAHAFRPARVPNLAPPRAPTPRRAPVRRPHSRRALRLTGTAVAVRSPNLVDLQRPHFRRADLRQLSRAPPRAAICPADLSSTPDLQLSGLPSPSPRYGPGASHSHNPGHPGAAPIAPAATPIHAEPQAAPH